MKFNNPLLWFLMFIGSAVKLLGLFYLKKSTQNPNMYNNFLALYLCSMIIIGYIFFWILKLGKKLVITNIVFDALVAIFTVLLSLFILKEKIKPSQLVLVIIIIVSVSALAYLEDH